MKVVKTNIDSNIDIKLCLLADIHLYHKYNIKKLDKIVNKIFEFKPNYICITGDIIDTADMQYDDEMKYLYNFIEKLSKIAKVVISLGNHDITIIRRKRKEYLYPDRMVETFRHMSNVVILDNTKFIENNVCFIGYTQSYKTLGGEVGYEMDIVNEVNALIPDISNDNYNILLSHNPLYITKKEVYEKIPNYNKLKLILSGHTHNGMLPNFLNTNKVLITPAKKWFKKNGRGHFKEENVDVIVTGGVIKLSKTAGILHLFNFLFATNMDYILIGGNNNEGVKPKK